jgi:hypothetical protein
MRSGKQPAAMTEAQATKILKLLRQESDSAGPRIRAMLAAGEDTQALRIEIAALERRIQDATMTLEAIVDERARKAAEAGAAEAARLEQDFAARIEALMRSLQAPEHPAQERHANV